LHLITLNDTHTFGRPPLDEESVRRIHKRRTNMPSAELEPSNPAS